MKTKEAVEHTQGEWKAETFCHETDGTHRIHSNGTTIAEVYVNPRLNGADVKEGLTNARLIAAAPDMLKALEELIDLAPTIMAHLKDYKIHTGEVLRKAEAAITKARGGKA